MNVRRGTSRIAIVLYAVWLVWGLHRVAVDINKSSDTWYPLGWSDPCTQGPRSEKDACIAERRRESDKFIAENTQTAWLSFGLWTLLYPVLLLALWLLYRTGRWIVSGFRSPAT
jgi:hypothetical protein